MIQAEFRECWVKLQLNDDDCVGRSRLRSNRFSKEPIVFIFEITTCTKLLYAFLSSVFASSNPQIKAPDRVPLKYSILIEQNVPQRFVWLFRWPFPVLLYSVPRWLGAWRQICLNAGAGACLFLVFYKDLSNSDSRAASRPCSGFCSVSLLGFAWWKVVRNFELARLRTLFSGQLGIAASCYWTHAISSDKCLRFLTYFSKLPSIGIGIEPCFPYRSVFNDVNAVQSSLIGAYLGTTRSSKQGETTFSGTSLLWNKNSWGLV